MKLDRKEEIIIVTLELAAIHGLGNVSMNMIAEKIGIKKPSLYNHFASKEDIVEAMYVYLRDKTKERTIPNVMDYNELFSGKSALEILQLVVDNYIKLNEDVDMVTFYKVIYSERCISNIAAQIMADETKKMILATKQLFYAMQVNKLLFFENPDQSAISFAMTVHGLMDYKNDIYSSGKSESAKEINSMINDYLVWFCQENKFC
ncbi:TetR/AcrR family transcriptional regulator [Intestinibacter sp.]